MRKIYTLALALGVACMAYAADDSEWKSIGECSYTEDIFTGLWGAVPNGYETTWNVAIEENVNTPGFYRLADPYASDPYWSYYCTPDPDRYFYLNAVDPDNVFVSNEDGGPEFLYFTGVNCDFGGDYGNYGDAYITSMVSYLVSIGDDPAGWYGKNENGVVTFPQEAFYFYQTGYYDGYYFSGNQNGNFKIVLPETTGINNIVSADEDVPVEYFNLQGQRVANPDAESGLLIRRQGRSVSKVFVK